MITGAGIRFFLFFFLDNSKKIEHYFPFFTSEYYNVFCFRTYYKGKKKTFLVNMITGAGICFFLLNDSNSLATLLFTLINILTTSSVWA